MGLDKQPSSARSLVLRTLAYSLLTSTTITGIASWQWKREPTLLMRRMPGVYYQELAQTAALYFWLTFILLGGSLWVYRTLKAGSGELLAAKRQPDELHRGPRGH